MTALQRTFVPQDLQIFRLTIGEAMADLVRQRYPRDTAKHIARAWNIDASTATNVVRGHCSERTLAKAFIAEGWPLIEALGAAITGETHAEHQERRLKEIIGEGQKAHAELMALRARREALERRSVDALDAFDRSLAEPQRDVDGRTRRAAGQSRHSSARGDQNQTGSVSQNPNHRQP